MTLVPCSGCARHVRVTEARCPFCEAAVRVPEVLPRDPSSRLGRAAIFAFGTSTAVLVGTLAGCSGGPAAIYGGPPTTVAPPSTGSGPQIPSTITPPPPDTSTIYAPYGAPHPPDPPPTDTPPVPPEVES